MSRVLYLLRKPPKKSIVASLVAHEVGGLNVGALRTACGSWPPNVVLAHLGSCSADGCEPGCPVRSTVEQVGRAAPDRFIVPNAPEVAERPPWMR